jgi:hypothetical protein
MSLGALSRSSRHVATVRRRLPNARLFIISFIRAALGVRHNVAIAIDVAIVWVRQVTLLETEGRILGNRYAQSKPLDKACSLRPEARQLGPEDFDPERRERASSLSIDLAILLTACSVCLTWPITAIAQQAVAAVPYKQSEVPIERRVDDLLHLFIWKAERQWVVEPGRYTLWVGSSLTSLTTSFHLNP